MWTRFGSSFDATIPATGWFFADDISVTNTSPGGSVYVDNKQWAPAVIAKDHGAAKAVIVLYSMDALTDSNGDTMPDNAPYKWRSDVLGGILEDYCGVAADAQDAGDQRIPLPAGIPHVHERRDPDAGEELPVRQHRDQRHRRRLAGLHDPERPGDRQDDPRVRPVPDRRNEQRRRVLSRPPAGRPGDAARLQSSGRHKHLRPDRERTVGRPSLRRPELRGLRELRHRRKDRHGPEGRVHGRRRQRGRRDERGLPDALDQRRHRRRRKHVLAVDSGPEPGRSRLQVLARRAEITSSRRGSRMPAATSWRRPSRRPRS